MDIKNKINYYSRIVKDKVTDADAYYGRALCMRYFDKKKAYEDFKKAFKYNRKFKERAHYYYGLINFHIENLEFKKAIKLIDKFHNGYSCVLEDDEKECMMRKALIFALTENYEEAMKAVSEVEKIEKRGAEWLSDIYYWNVDFFYSDTGILSGNIYLIKGETPKAYACFTDTAQKAEKIEGKDTPEIIKCHNDFILVPSYLFMEEKEKFLRRINEALSRNNDKGYFYSWYAAYAKKYINDEKAREILVKAIENGYINEGILKSRILQGYFLRDFFTNKRISDYYRFELKDQK